MEMTSTCVIPNLGSSLPEMGRRATARGKRVPRADRTASSRARTSLADALFSKTQKRVLGFLFGQPERSFFASELITLVGSGSGSVQRELERLLSSGLITVTQFGNQKHYQANAQSPIFTELRDLVIKTVGAAEPLRQALLPLADRIQLAILYGSVAKAGDTATSDIDILIVSPDLALDEAYDALAQVEKRMARPIKPLIYSPQEFLRRRRDGHHFLTRVLSGQHIVLIGSENAVRA